MAERFGGKYSPNTPASGPETGPPPRNSFDGKRPDRAGGRVNVLFVASLFLLIPAFTGGPDALLRGLGATALLLLASWLTREGVIAQDAYDARRVARRPAIPRKMFGSVLIGLGLALGASISQPGLVMPVLFGLAGAALHLFSFGPDPLANKGMEGTDTFQTDRVARAVVEAEKMLAGMKDAILRAQARAMFRTIENDPRDLTAARKYLSVYLTGARDATVKFADHYRATRDAQARTDYVGLLDDLESNFTARTQLLLTDNRTDLDVEIGVLRERLQREG